MIKYDTQLIINTKLHTGKMNKIYQIKWLG